MLNNLFFCSMDTIRLCHKEGHADTPHQKVIENGAQCSESNEEVDKKNFRFLFFELSSKIRVIFQKNDTIMVITRKIKIAEF